MKYASISSLSIAALLAATGCGNTPGGLERAQKTFADKIWTPFLQTDRCNNCHDFVNLRTGFYSGHPDAASTCTNCHSSAVLGFSTPPWHRAPDTDHWSKTSDPNTVRDHILAFGPGLYTHLVGEGIDQQPLVQWCFFNGPDTTANGGAIKAGAVPAGGPHSGQISSGLLLDWNQYKANVEEWLCLEKAIGNNNLGLPDNVDCFRITVCGAGGLMNATIATFGALACVVTVRRIRRRRG